MNSHTRTFIAGTLVCVMATGLFGAVLYEAATSIGVVHRHNLLASILNSLPVADDNPAELQAAIAQRGILSTNAMTAAVITPGGMIELLGDDNTRTQLLYVANHIRQNPNLEPHQASIEVEETSYVWASRDSPGLGGRLVLINEYPSGVMPSVLKLLVVPVVISVLIMGWLFIWFVLITRQRLVATQRSHTLELELIRQEEAGRITAAFLANMSHELRTPLNAIIGFSGILRNELFGPLGSSRYRDYADDIARSGDHLVTMVGNILDISKIESGEETLEEEVFSVQGATADCLRIIDWDTVGQEHTLEVDMPDGLPFLRADRGKIRQVLINLITNAIKFTPEGGIISVRSDVLPDGRLTLEVADTGKGIAEKDIELVMRPFGRAQSEPGHAKDGTGLGLPLSRSLIRLHDGSFNLWSMVDVGTTIRIVFPRDRSVANDGTAEDAGEDGGGNSGGMKSGADSGADSGVKDRNRKLSIAS